MEGPDHPEMKNRLGRGQQSILWQRSFPWAPASLVLDHLKNKAQVDFVGKPKQRGMQSCFWIWLKWLKSLYLPIVKWKVKLYWCLDSFTLVHIRYIFHRCCFIHCFYSESLLDDNRSQKKMLIMASSVEWSGISFNNSRLKARRRNLVNKMWMHLADFSSKSKII